MEDQKAPDHLHILAFEAENYKKIRIVEIKPKHRLIQITGRNGQGKTALLDSLWAAFAGKARILGVEAVPDKPVRHGADKARMKFVVGNLKTGKKEIIGRRTIDNNRITKIELESGTGTKFSSPAAMLDELIGELAFDPLEFSQSDTRVQIEWLRKIGKSTYDHEAANAANKADFDARTVIGREVARLKGEVSGLTVQDGLPKAKIDEAAINKELTESAQTQLEQKRIDDAKAKLEDAYKAHLNTRARMVHQVEQADERVTELEAQLKAAKNVLAEARADLKKQDPIVNAAQKAWQDAPEGKVIDVSALVQELQQAQLTNREIDRRDRRDRLQAELDKQEKEVSRLTRQIDTRNEKKAQAVAEASKNLPVPGLIFDENAVLINGIPIKQLGEAEQIKVSCLIAMAMNPKLRILRILHGEALDEDNLAVLAALAEEHDFQIWMARVDSSGKTGIILEDGEIKADMQEAEA